MIARSLRPLARRPRRGAHTRAPDERMAAWLALFALFALFGSGCRRSDVADERSPNLVLIVVDTLRRDHLGAYGYARDTSPRLDALAERGLLFENPVAQSSWTLPSVASLFTSRLPAEINASKIDGAALRAVGDGYATLAAALAANGYRTISVSANPYFVPAFGLTRGFGEHAFVHGARADRLVDQALAILDTPPGDASQQDADAPPFFLYLHFMDVHAPNHPPPPYDAMFPTLDGAPHDRTHWTFAFTDGKGLDSRAFEVYRSHKLALYDGSIRFVDAQIGRLVDALAERGWLETTALWIASDHGEELWEHAALEERLGLDNKGRYGVEHGHSLVPELIEVPLIASGAGIPNGRVAGQVRNLDVAPTLLALAGAAASGAPASSFAGVDLLARWRSGDSVSLPAWSDTHTRAHRLISWRRDGEQLLRIGAADHLFARRGGRTALPLVEVSDDRPVRLSELGAEVDDILKRLHPAEGRTVRLDTELRDQLEALGYLR